jgi:gamma-glutamylcyclotransferase (GGCT)/AIG2-like uncharacterized protein YtfP
MGMQTVWIEDDGDILMAEDTSLIFVYGILKRGFSADLTKYGGKFLGKAEIVGANLHPIGGGVGLRFTEDTRRVAYGELFEIPNELWRWLDSIESNGFAYTRKIVPVILHNDSSGGEVILDMLNAWVYEHTFPDMRYREPFEDGVYHAALYK